MKRLRIALVFAAALGISGCGGWTDSASVARPDDSRIVEAVSTHDGRVITFDTPHGDETRASPYAGVVEDEVQGYVRKVRSRVAHAEVDRIEFGDERYFRDYVSTEMVAGGIILVAIWVALSL